LTGECRDKVPDQPDQLSGQGAVLVEVIKTLYLQYDGVNWVATLVKDAVENMQATTGSITNWADLLINQPQHYAGISLAVDLSLRWERHRRKTKSKPWSPPLCT
jgi:hypothetical protein